MFFKQILLLKTQQKYIFEDVIINYKHEMHLK